MSFEQSGPYVPGLKMEEVIAQGVDVWARSSLMMQSIASSQGIAYFHILQPNQYVDRSKPFSQEEKATYVTPSEYAQATTAGYRLLVARGRELALPGYFDATE